MTQGVDRGFSLIEVLIVITVLATIAGGIYGIYDSSIAHARLNAMKAKRRAIKTAIEHYYARNDAYPPTLDALTKSYLSEIPDDPLTKYQGCDWLIRGPEQGDQWVSCLDPNTAVNPPAKGVFDVRSSSGL